MSNSKIVNFKDLKVEHPERYKIISDDSSEVTKTIRFFPGVTYQEGTPETAENFNNIQKNCVYTVLGTKTIEGQREIYNIAIEGSSDFSFDTLNVLFIPDITNTKEGPYLRFNNEFYILKNSKTTCKIGDIFENEKILLQLNFNKKTADVCGFIAGGYNRSAQTLKNDIDTKVSKSGDSIETISVKNFLKIGEKSYKYSRQYSASKTLNPTIDNYRNIPLGSDGGFSAKITIYAYMTGELNGSVYTFRRTAGGTPILRLLGEVGTSTNVPTLFVYGDANVKIRTEHDSEYLYIVTVEEYLTFAPATAFANEEQYYSPFNKPTYTELGNVFEDDMMFNKSVSVKEALNLGEKYHRYSRQYSASKTLNPTIRNFRNLPLGSDGGFSAKITIYAEQTSELNGSVYTFRRTAGGTPVLKLIGKIGTGNNIPELFIYNNENVKIITKHDTEYLYNVTIEEYQSSSAPVSAFVDCEQYYSPFNKPTKSDVGLDLADNTSDITKSVRSAARLTTARDITIGNKVLSFDGSSNIEYPLSDIGAAPKGFGLGENGISMGFKSSFLGYSVDSQEVPFIGAGFQSVYKNDRRAQLYITTQNKVYSRFSLSSEEKDSSTPWVRHYTDSDKPSISELGFDVYESLNQDGGVYYKYPNGLCVFKIDSLLINAGAGYVYTTGIMKEIFDAKAFSTHNGGVGGHSFTYASISNQSVRISFNGSTGGHSSKLYVIGRWK